MKARTSKLMLFLGIVLLFGAASTHAQGPAGQKVKFSVPFSFSAGTKSFPAGDYTVVRISSTSDGYWIRSADGKITETVLSAASLVSSGQMPQAKLVFQTLGGRHFLSQVWLRSRNGNELHKSRAQRELARAGQPSENVIVVAE